MSNFKFSGKGDKVWDPDSLRRALVKDFPGCKTVQEAIELERSRLKGDNPPPIPPLTEVSETTPIYDLTRDALKAIEAEFDPIAKYPPEIVRQLAEKQLKTAQDVIEWRDAWLTLIRSKNP